MKRRRFNLLILATILLAAGIAYWRLTAFPPASDEQASKPPAISNVEKVEKVETEADRNRRMLLGVWQDEYKGKRTMTLNDDGTGTMLVELSGASAFVMGAKLRFDMEWSLNGKKLTMTNTGGEPADKVNLILNMMGKSAEDTLLELTNDRLLLLDKDGKTQYDWRRAAQPTTVPKDGT